MAKNKIFLNLLLEKKIIDEPELERLIELYQSDAFEILMYLVNNKIEDKHKLGRLWGDSIGLSYVDIKKASFNEDVIKKFPEGFARKNIVIPLYQMGKAITVIASKPQNSFMIDKLENILNTQISSLFCFEEDIEEAINYYYSGFKNEEKNKLKGNSNNINMTNEKKTDLVNSQTISEEHKQHLLNNTRQIMDGVKKGEIPSADNCHAVSNCITDEILPKVDLKYCIKQLRINDEYTYAHSINTAILASLMGKSLGFSTSVIKELTLGALLHDIGFMKIPKVILYKRDKLTSEELTLKNKHPVFGYEIIKKIGLHDKIAEIALNHHETLNGKGYPRGLKGDQISLNTQILAVVNIYDSLISDKLNKKAISHTEALNIMMLEAYKLFNFDILEKFINLAYKNDIATLKKSFKITLFGDLTNE
ncbi:MAG: HD domain-containing protein [Candidatus Gastranaerophilales bacterium]|nr:HD domain-containing protein [Candidatus Gastranaerophilales bacterium]